MIANLRYYVNFDEDMIHVKWNWIDVKEDIKAKCCLQKCLTCEEIDSVEDITLTYYHENAGGCAFKMPDEPVKIVVCEENGESVQCKIDESPRYEIQYVVKEIKEEIVTKRFLRTLKKKIKKLQISVLFPSQLREEEMRKIEEWVFCGIISERLSSRFFLPFIKAGRCDYPLFEHDLPKVEDICIGSVPEIQGTIYENLFDFKRVDKIDENAAKMRKPTEKEVNTASGVDIDFDRLAAKDQENGLYPITCPFCFHEFSYRDFEFRVKSYSGSSNCHEPEEDEKYRKFCEERDFNQAIARQKLGKVLSFSREGEIAKFSYISCPDTFLEANGKELIDVVNCVMDQYGNKTWTKLCPNCHNPLPALSGKYPSLAICMMGNTGSGKSVYMMQMIHLLDSGMLLPGYNFRCRPNDNIRSSEILKQYKSIFLGETAQVQERFGSHKEEHIQPSFEEIGGFQFDTNHGISFEDAPVAPFSPVPGTGTFLFGAKDGSMLSGDTAFEGALSLQSASPNNDDPLSFLAVKYGDFDAGNIKSIPQWEKPSFDDKIVTNSVKLLPEATTRIYSEPCIYEMLGTDPHTQKNVGFILSIFDFPGEAIWGGNRLDEATLHDQYLEKVNSLVSGFIFMFDPSFIRKVRGMPNDKIDRFIELTLGSSKDKLSTLLQQKPIDILNSFQRKFGNPVGKFKAPIAMVLSKIDAIRDLLEDIERKDVGINSRFLEERRGAMQKNRVKIDIQDMQACSDIVKAFVNEDGLKNICDAIAENYMWFSVSSMGIAPKDGSLSGKYGVPVRVLDPVEWILFKNAENHASRKLEAGNGDRQ